MLFREVILKKRFFSLFFVFFFFYGINTSVFAELDPAVLMGILSQLAGTGVRTSTGSSITYTGTNSSVSSNITPPVWIPAVWTTSLTNKNSHIWVTPSMLWNSTGSITAPSIVTIPKKVETVVVPDKKAIPDTEIILPTKEMVTEKKISNIPSFKILKVETGDKKATFTFRVADETPNITKFEFLYADTEGKSNKVFTYEKERIKNINGDYVWYIPNLALTKYVVSIAWVGADGETIPMVISQPFEANLSLLSAGKCIIPNVSGLRVLPKRDTSVLYWDSIPEAINYKIYKKDASGEYVFIQETKNDSYTIHVSDGSVKYEEFSVKAVCSDGTESLKFSPSTAVRTGPSELILLGLISFIISFVIVRRRKQILWKW